MKTTDKIIAKVILTAPASKGYRGQIIATASAEQYGGNSHPHFSVTGEISTPAERNKGDFQTGGCIHDEILKAFPFLAPLVALHLSNSDNGEPMHAEANGFYWLAGAFGGFGEEYHGGSGNDGKDVATCLDYAASTLRISKDDAQHLGEACAIAYKTGCNSVASSEEVTKAAQREQAKAGNIAARNVFHTFIVSQRDRWQQEATEGLNLIIALSQKAA